MTPKLSLTALAVAALALGAIPAAAQRQLHVAIGGADGNPGSATQPFKTVQKAVSVARAGDTILVHAGTYGGVIEIKSSGTQGRPIVLRSAGDGETILRASLPRASCAATAPTRNRTVQVLAGADHWVIRGLTIVGGILVAGKDSAALDNDQVLDHTLPGRDEYDPVAAATLLPKLGIDAADHVRIVENRIVGRGIQVIAARYGRIARNEVSGVECGTGAGILLSRFSDGWDVKNNLVRDNQPSKEHPMEEGVRVGSGSAYNLIEGNVVENMAGRGRGFSADAYASWNRYVDNRARNTYVGFNEQTGGWGNTWEGNRAEASRKFAFSLDGKSYDQPLPDEGSPAYGRMARNCAVGNPYDLNVGSLQRYSFADNSFTSFRIAENPQAYWGAAGNVYDGSSQAPEGPKPAKDWCK